MTKWQWSANIKNVLTIATVAMVTALTSGVVMGCPDVCQCTQTYYAYCQKIGLTSDTVKQVVMDVPYEALLLDLSSNSLVRLSSGLFDPVPNLEYLFLNNNRLQSLGMGLFSQQHKLKELSLSNNRLKEIVGGVYVNMSNLRKLHLDHNDIEGIQIRAFALPQLQELYLHENKLTVLAPSQLHGLTSLQILDLSDNLIQSLEVGAFQDLPNLQVLRLSRNRLSSLAENAFQGLTSLKKLYLDGNMLPSLDCFDVPNFANTLQHLVLSNNSLVAVPRDVFAKLRSLKVLALNHNRISSVGQQAFEDLQLDALSLAHNNLDIVNRDMLDGTRRISRLDLSFNRLHTIKTGAFDSFRESVYVLNLAGNNLATLDRGMFRGMRNLQTLNLSSNALWSILDGSFTELVQLVNLDLDDNELQWLSADLLQGPSLQRLSVLDNPIRELRGFTFDSAGHPVSVFVNLTLQSSSVNSITVSWPFRQGSQLYWRLQLWCVARNSSDSSCDSPIVESSIQPNRVSEKVVGLQPGTEYFICVNPIFLSRDVKVSQCGKVSTLQRLQTTVKPEGPEGHTSNSGHSPKARTPFLWTCVVVVIVVIMCPDFWTVASSLISHKRTQSFGIGNSVSCGVLVKQQS